MEPSRYRIWSMFDEIATTYDKVNRYMTFGLDMLWRKKLASLVPSDTQHVLDCATGTGDQILALYKKSKNIQTITGIDLSKNMLSIAQEKLKAISRPKISLLLGDIENLPFAENSFDAITLSFGIRNVVSLDQALSELLRVLKPGRPLLILETAKPKSPVCKTLHSLYLSKAIPLIGGAVSHKKEAYQYLHQTAQTFPSGDSLCSRFQKHGFKATTSHPLMFGAVSIYQAIK